MDVSLIYEISTPDPNDDEQIRQAYRDAAEQVELADELGFHCVWLTEHHFMPGLSHSSSPEVTLGNWAARTKNIRLGHGVTLLPVGINHPVRVAERTATLDILSEGRLEFGGGRAITLAELEAFGVNPDDSRDQWEEGFRLLPKAWTEDDFSFEGEWVKFPQRKVIPRPVQQPHPPLWTAATQPATLESAGRMGIGALVFGVGYELVSEYNEIYRKAIAECTDPVGHFINDRFAGFLMCMCCETDDEAVEIQGGNYKRYLETIAEIFKPWDKADIPKSYEYFVNFWEQAKPQLESATMEEIVEMGSAAIGSPETCLGVMQKLADSGADEALLFMQAYNSPHEKVMRSIELIGKEVMPKLEHVKAAGAKEAEAVA
jgi:alkanesulfonate monooxygenase SsuD/methylene tetrahydromethanopterin reductase-like flavin-dependent oxidoreductase (luciferase family)